MSEEHSHFNKDFIDRMTKALLQGLGGMTEYEIQVEVETKRWLKKFYEDCLGEDYDK